MTAAGMHQALSPARPVPGIGTVRIPWPLRPLLPGGPEEPAVAAGPPPMDPDERARYRWWLGHQLTFCVWRLLAERLAMLATGEHRAAEHVAAATALYDAYSVLLCYAGSCTPEVYERIIRPEMARADPAFSGRWARDYEDVPALLKEVQRTRPAAVVGNLMTAARENRMAHFAMAKRLVPVGASLLRQSGWEHDRPVTDRERGIFDAFFLIARQETSRAAFTAQVGALTTLVLADLADCPLEDAGDTPPTRFRRDAVAVLRTLLVDRVPTP